MEETLWEKALKKIREASQQLADGLDTRGMDRATALKCLLTFNNALEPIVKCLDRLPKVEEIAKPGPTLKERLKEIRTAICEKEKEISSLREDLEKLVSLEAELEQRNREREELQKRLDNLRHLQALVKSVDLEELRRQVKELEDCQELLKAGELEQVMVKAAEGLIRLTEEQIKHLKEEARNLLALVKRQEENLKRARDELEQIQERYRLALKEWQQYQEDLKHYEELYSRIASALPESANRRDALVAIEKFRELRKTVEEALRIAIEENEREQQRKPLFLGG